MALARLAVIVCTFCLLLTSCESAQSHRESVEDTKGDRVTVVTVQRQIRVGMSGAEVARVATDLARWPGGWPMSGHVVAPGAPNDHAKKKA